MLYIVSKCIVQKFQVPSYSNNSHIILDQSQKRAKATMASSPCMA